MRKITVRGIGKLNLKADCIVVSVTLNAKDETYDGTVALAERQADALKKALVGAGFLKEDLKTKDFSVRTVYNNERDKSGNYRQVFAGYCCRNDLSLTFGLDMQRLGKALNAIAESKSNAEFHVQFTVKDRDAASEALLDSAVKDAYRKAQTLAKAAGATLGELSEIEYNRAELNLNSPTRYAADGLAMSARAVEIEPEDIVASDFVTVVWEIV